VVSGGGGGGKTIGVLGFKKGWIWRESERAEKYNGDVMIKRLKCKEGRKQWEERVKMVRGKWEVGVVR